MPPVIFILVFEIGFLANFAQVGLKLMILLPPPLK
jgi:hypothetical protein